MCIVRASHSGVGDRNEAQYGDERVENAGDNSREFVRKLCLEPQSFAAPTAASASRAKERTPVRAFSSIHTSSAPRTDPDAVIRSRMRFCDANGFSFVHREHQLVLRAEVAVERASRQAGPR